MRVDVKQQKFLSIYILVCAFHSDLQVYTGHTTQAYWLRR
jgi:hypothetical protein